MKNLFFRAGNDDVELWLSIADKRYEKIMKGGDDFKEGYGCYEGEKFRTNWYFYDKKVYISGQDGMVYGEFEL